MQTMTYLFEQGHRRWESEVEGAFSKFIDALHENLLPAIDRTSILASHLRGLSRYHDSKERFNLQPFHLTDILEALQSMRLIVHESLNIAIEDRRQFLAFSKWLRFQIELHTSETNADSEESIEQQASFDYGQILSYIQGEFMNPKLSFYWGRRSDAHVQNIKNEAYEKEKIDLKPDGVAAVIEEIRAEQESYNDARLPFWFFKAKLQHRIKDASSELGAWQKKMASMPGGLVLEENEESSSVDMRMVFEVGVCDHLGRYSTHMNGLIGTQGIREIHDIRSGGPWRVSK